MKIFKIILSTATMIMMAGFGFAQTWTQANLPDMYWHCFASSADGSTLVAEPVDPGIILVSTNGGFTWSTNTLPNVLLFGQPYNLSFTSVASCADGTKLAGVSIGGFICTSTNSGTTWMTNDAPSAAWYSIASSADGTQLTAVAGGAENPAGPIYISTNSGNTWLPTSAPSNHWRSIASSADGTILLAGNDFSLVSSCVSTNSGAIWTQTSLDPNKQWHVAVSADGNKMVAAYYSDSQSAPVPGHIFTSMDAGNTWKSNRLVSGYFGSVALSADGSKIMALDEDASVFVSTDFGASWTTNTVSGVGSDLFYSYLASSADGGKLIIGSSFTQLAYVLQSVYPPQMNLRSSPASLDLSWIIPSTNFVLQQSSDLISWADVTNTPLLNLTHLENEVALSPSNNNSFYRLKTP